MTDRYPTFFERDRQGAETQERRQDERCESQVGITVTADSTAFLGHAQNVSRAGVFFFSGDQLRVTVELERDGETVSRQGHLVRVERINEETTGFAIEFDHH